MADTTVQTSSDMFDEIHDTLEEFSLTLPEYQNDLDKTIENLPIYAKSVALTMIKRLENGTVVHERSSDYYVGTDTVRGVCYLAMKNVMMIDIDTQSQKFLDKLDTYEDLFEVYSTRKGYHAFCVSKHYEHRDLFSYAELMLNLESDYFYVAYSYVKGWCVRLNYKEDEVNAGECLYKFIGMYGKKDSIVNAECSAMVKKHIELADKWCKISEPVRILPDINYE